MIVAEEWSPYWTIRTSPDGGEEYGGVLYELLLFMQRARDFNFTVVRSPDGSWGDGGCASANESVGMMGMAARNEVDLAIGEHRHGRCHKRMEQHCVVLKINISEHCSYTHWPLIYEIGNLFRFIYPSHLSRVALTNFRVRADRVQGNQVHSISVRGLGIQQTHFQPIPMHH